MLTVSPTYKTAMQEPVKDVKGYLELADATKLDGSNDLVEFKTQATGGLLKASMKQIDITLLGKHELLGVQLTAYYGVRIAGTYEYKSLGKFNILTAEYSKDKDTTKLTGYDNMVLFQRDYLPVSEFPTTLFGFTQSLAAGVGVTLTNTSLFNGALDMPEDYWATIPEATYRDVLNQICEVVVCTARIDVGGNLELIELDNPSGETLTYDNLIEYDLGKKWGGVNSVVLSRQPQNDDIFKQDEIDIRYPMNRNILDLEAFNVGYGVGA